MGCTQSKIENEEAVSRCKDRKQFMKDAVAHRNAFAAAHSSYAVSLKNTGAALSDFAEGEVHPRHALPSSTSSQPPVETLPPPPPPPSHGPSPLQRAVSMPEFSIPKTDLRPSQSIIEEEGSEEDDEIHGNSANLRQRSRRRGRGSEELPPPTSLTPLSPPRPPPLARAEPPPPPENQDSPFDFFFSGPENMPGPSLSEPMVVDEMPKRVEEHGKIEMVAPPPPPVEEMAVEAVPPPPPVAEKAVKVVKRVAKGGVSLLQIFNELDDQFLKASESAHEVSKLLEANRLHYHSNFADNRGHIDHHARVMRVITWNRSFRGLPNNDDGKDDFDSDENETHATVLDKLLAWEKKLYDEVKAGEIMKFDYQRKIALLNKQKKRGPNSESLEKTKAQVSHLHTRYIVDMQSLDSTVSEINRLRDKQLYPSLVTLVNGMAIMWDTMRVHHAHQSKIATALKSIDISQSPKETSSHHYERTNQLCVVVRDWHSHFVNLISNQRNYISALKSWLKLNLVPIESSLKERELSSPPRPQKPPIQILVLRWSEYLEKLPEDLAKSAIFNFSAVFEAIVQHQDDEMKLKEKCEDTRKELARKTRHLEDWKRKYLQKRTPPDMMNEDGVEDTTFRDAVAEKQFALDVLQKQLDDETEAHERQCIQVRDKSLVNLRTRLPELFQAMADFSFACSNMYKELRSITQSSGQGSS